MCMCLSVFILLITREQVNFKKISFLKFFFFKTL